ncbi:BgTH12-03474 [Blumeria graminis f. sp. triticale]|nr:BgTH12-03474 [Blumeria graminis f. sp. triticale]
MIMSSKPLKRKPSTEILYESDSITHGKKFASSASVSYRNGNELKRQNTLQTSYETSENDSNAETPIMLSSTRKKRSSLFKYFNCTFEGCSKAFNRQARLAAHLRSHSNERPFVCTKDGCQKAYMQEKHLKHHVKSFHTQERDFHCDWEGCDKSFLTSSRLNRHIEAHQGRERYKCVEFPPCNQTFRKHQTLQRHVRAEHLHLSPFPCTFVDPITKESCNLGFEGPSGLRRHQECAHGTARYFCTECTLSGSFNTDGTPIHPGFSSYRKLEAHIRKEHANCIFCDIKCRSQRELLAHIDSQHSGKSIQERRKYPCNEPGCDKRFTTKYNLNAHIRSAHLGNRFICGTFHVDTHPNIPGWTDSNGCGCDFISKQSLIDHIRYTHLKLKRKTGHNVTIEPNLEFKESDVINNLEDLYSNLNTDTQFNGSIQNNATNLIEPTECTSSTFSYHDTGYNNCPIKTSDPQACMENISTVDKFTNYKEIIPQDLELLIQIEPDTPFEFEDTFPTYLKEPQSKYREENYKCEREQNTLWNDLFPFIRD